MVNYDILLKNLENIKKPPKVIDREREELLASIEKLNREYYNSLPRHYQYNFKGELKFSRKTKKTNNK